MHEKVLSAEIFIIEGERKEWRGWGIPRREQYFQRD